MKSRALLLLLGVLLLANVEAAPADGAVSREAALKAIDVFQKDPSSAEGFAAASTIMGFAEKSSTVRIALSKAVIPWIKGQDAPDADTRNMLMSAYVAGDLAAQLKSGKAEDDVYAGWKQVLATYAQLHAINPTVKLPEIDALKDKEAAGTLKAYATGVQAQQKTQSFAPKAK